MKKLTKCVEFTSIIGAGITAFNISIMIQSFETMIWVYMGTVLVMTSVGIVFQRTMKFHEIDHEDERSLNEKLREAEERDGNYSKV